MPDLARLAEAIAPIASDGVHRGAQVLNSMLHADVQLQTPSTLVVDPAYLADRLRNAYTNRIAWVNMQYRGDLDGAVELVFGLEDASRLAAVISADLSPGDDSDATRTAVVSEVGNVVINSVVGTMSNALDLHLRFTVPEYSEGRADDILARVGRITHPRVILVETEFHVARLDIHGHMILYFSMPTLTKIQERLASDD
jgi:chemotaxis protein CheC